MTEDIITTPEAVEAAPEAAEDGAPESGLNAAVSEPVSDSGDTASEHGDLPPGFSESGLRQFLRGRHARQIAADARLREHFNRLSRQARALREQYPDFDLAREMQDPVFARLTAPGVGIDPATAYEIVHHQSLRDAARRADLLRVSQAVRSGSLRPAENALTGSHAAIPLHTDPRSLSPADRVNIRQRVARGERVVL